MQEPEASCYLDKADEEESRVLNILQFSSVTIFRHSVMSEQVRTNWNIMSAKSILKGNSEDRSLTGNCVKEQQHFSGGLFW